MGQDLSQILNGWIDEGFFDQKRTLADVRDRFHQQAIMLPMSSIPKYLLRAVRAHRLRRNKEEVSNKMVWVYIKQ